MGLNRAVLIGAVGLLVMGSANAAHKDEIRLSTVGESNLIPFSPVYSGNRYQQVIYPGAFPPSDRIEIEGIAFTSQPGEPSICRVAAIIRLATVSNVLPNFFLNFGDEPRIIWSGVNEAVLTGAPDDLKFNFKGRPYFFNPFEGGLLIDIEVISVEGAPRAFRWGAHPLMERVWVDGAGNVLQSNTGLDITISVKVK